MEVIAPFSGNPPNSIGQLFLRDVQMIPGRIISAFFLVPEESSWTLSAVLEMFSSLFWPESFYMPLPNCHLHVRTLQVKNWSQSASLPSTQGQGVGGAFLHQPVARQNMKSFIEKWSSSNFHFSFLLLWWGKRIKEECFKRKLIILQDLWQQHSVGRRIGVGQVWWLGGHGPSLYHAAIQQCSYLRGKVGADRNDKGRGV